MQGVTGSSPVSPTTLRQGFGWQATPKTQVKGVPRSFSEGGLVNTKKEGTPLTQAHSVNGGAVCAAQGGTAHRLRQTPSSLRHRQITLPFLNVKSGRFFVA